MTRRSLFPSLLSLLFLLNLLILSSSSMEIKKSKISIINSNTLPGNLLPQFLFQQGSIEGGSIGVKIGGGKGTPTPFLPDDSCGDDIFDGAMEDMRSPQLPYLTQDLWTCDRKQVCLLFLPLDIPSQTHTVPSSI